MGKVPEAFDRFLVIPDTQDQPGAPREHLTALGRLIVETQPDGILHLGDHWDFRSLCTYVKPAVHAFNQEDVLADIEAGNEGLRALWAPVIDWNKRRPKRKRYSPPKWLLRGNHEHRLQRLVTNEPWLRGCLNPDLMESPGWTVAPFLQPIIIAGVKFSHYFCRSSDGKVKQSRRGAANARLMVMREGMSCTAGHQQGLSSHIQERGHRRDRGVIAGSFYLSDDQSAYLTPQGHNVWHGVLVKHGLRDGDYDLEEWGMDRLMRKFG
jgi:hypothetical protein